MPGTSSSLGCTYRGQCGSQELFDVDSNSLTNARNRAEEQHKKRLARIVVDQWMHVARKRLTMAWCFQMVHCWRKICLENQWTRQQSYLACKHHTHKKFIKVFNTFQESSQMKRRNQSITEKFHKHILLQKTFKGLNTIQLKYWQHHKKQCLTKAFRAIKCYHEMKKMTKHMYNGAQLFYGASLKKQAFNGFSKHQEHLKLKSFHQAIASYHWKKLIKSKILKCWSIIVKKILDLREKGDQSRIQVLKALLKRCMKNWLLVTEETVIAKQAKIVQASQKYNKSCKKLTLQAWAQQSQEKQSRQQKLEHAAITHSDRRSVAVTNAWRNYAIAKGESRAKASVAFSFRRRQALIDAIAVWKAYHAKKEKAGVATLKALAHLKQSLTKKSMATWKPWHERKISKKQDREKALEIYKSRLQRWACERILAVGLMLHGLRLQSRVGRQSILSTSSYMKVAPYARKWWYICQRRSNIRKALLHYKEEGSFKIPQKEELPLPNNKEPFTHEVLLRIGINKDGLRIQYERPSSPLLEMTNVQERPQPKGRALLPPPSSTTIQSSIIPTSSTIRQRPAPRRPAFLSFQIS